MPPSADDSGQSLALVAECLYLANLTVAPGLGFVVLLAIFVRQYRTAQLLARCHLRQALYGSLWAGLLLGILSAVVLLLGGFHSRYALITLILYFFSCHSLLILFGMAGIARALAGKPFVYPVIGVRCDG